MRALNQFQPPIHACTKPQGRLKLPSEITRLKAHFTCGLLSDLVIYQLQTYEVIYDVSVLTKTRHCYYLNNIKLKLKTHPINSLGLFWYILHVNLQHTTTLSAKGVCVSDQSSTLLYTTNIRHPPPFVSSCLTAPIMARHWQVTQLLAL